MTKNIALCVEYNGSQFNGWQSQREGRFAQTELEKALSFVANEPIQIHCAGRTDARVHASHQVVHFSPNNHRDERAWMMGANANLPKDICVRWAKEVPEDFHARFSALSRSYRYVISNTQARPAIFSDQLTWISYPLNHEWMHEAAQALLGENDFNAYRSVACQSRTSMRNITHISVKREKQFIVMDVTGNAFLYHMVRNIVGVLLEIGRGEKPVSWAKEVLDSKDRRQAGVTAPPNGLTLVNVAYPEHFSLPITEDLAYNSIHI